MEGYVFLKASFLHVLVECFAVVSIFNCVGYLASDGNSSLGASGTGFVVLFKIFAGPNGSNAGSAARFENPPDFFQHLKRVRHVYNAVVGGHSIELIVRKRQIHCVRL